MSGGRKLFLLVLGFSFLGMAGPALAQAPSTLNVGLLGISGEGPFYIAVDRGYFKEMGIEAKTELFASGARMMAPLAGGQLHTAGTMGINPALFNGVARGMPFTIVAGGAQQWPGHDSVIYMLRTDLKDQVKGFEDLKGKRFALNAPGSPNFYALGKALENFGMTVNDIKVVNIPFPDMPVAFERKAIDFSVQVEPGATLEQAKGVSIKWKKVSEFVNNPYMQIGAIPYNIEWAKKNSSLARSYMTAWVKGAREYYTASRRGPNRSEVTRIFTKYTRVKDAKLYDQMEWTYIDPNGRINLESIRDQQDWWYAQGQVPAKVPMEQLIDTSYVEFAIKTLGEYKAN